MKILLALIVVIAGAGAGIYFSGVMHMESPADQGKRVKQAADSGGTWEKVVDVLPPKKYYDVIRTSMAGHGAEQKFDRDEFANRLKNAKNADGYELIYNMSADVSFVVILDENGNLMGTHDLPTLKSLMQPNGAGLQ